MRGSPKRTPGRASGACSRALPLPLESLEADPQPKLPPLIKGYLRAGARVCGAPAWDPDFGTADFFMLLALDHLDARYAARFFPEATAPA